MNKKQKGWIIGGISGVVIIAVILVVASIRAQAATNSGSSAYQTTTVQKGTLTSTVEGTGSLASLLSAKLAWQTTGQVSQVNVQTGDQVKANDILATIAADPQTQTSLESDLVTAQENLAQLTSPSAIANAQLAVANAKDGVTTAQSALNGVQNWNNPALIQEQYANMVIAQAALDKAQQAYDNANVGTYINNSTEAILYQNLYNAQQKYNTAKYYYSLYSQAPSADKMAEAQANVSLANATLKSAQDYLTALTTGTIPTDATGTDVLKLKQAELAVTAAQQKLQDYLNSTNITAPFAGTITQTDTTMGATVSTGTTAFAIDDLTKLVVDVQVIEVDINNVKVGQPAAITFDAIPNKTYTGKVISADMSGTVGQNSVNFVATVELTNADALVKPGMSANVTILTNQVEGALLVPSTAIFTDSSGNQVVYLVQNGQVTPITVTTGATSDTTTEITSNNLQEGDTIILSFASSSSSSSTGGLRLFGGFGGGGTGNRNTTNINNGGGTTANP